MTSDLARLLALVADDLDRHHYQAAGVVRQGAQALAAVVAPVGGCPQCGGEVEQPKQGRRRVYCSAPCRKRANRGRNATLPE